MQTEILFMADDFFSGSASLADVLERQETFIDARLAEHYGVGAGQGDGWVPVSLPGRAGLFGTAGC